MSAKDELLMRDAIEMFCKDYEVRTVDQLTNLSQHESEVLVQSVRLAVNPEYKADIDHEAVSECGEFTSMVTILLCDDDLAFAQRIKREIVDYWIRTISWEFQEMIKEAEYKAEADAAAKEDYLDGLREDNRLRAADINSSFNGYAQ